MTELILNKILFIIMVMSILNCLQHVWRVVNNLMKDVPDKYSITKIDSILLGFSLSYIITTIFTGIKI